MVFFSPFGGKKKRVYFVLPRCRRDGRAVQGREGKRLQALFWKKEEAIRCFFKLKGSAG